MGHVYEYCLGMFPGYIHSWFANRTADNMPYGDPGIVTTHKRKLDYANALRHAMNTGNLFIWSDLCVANRFIEHEHERYALTWQKLLEQLSRYRIVLIESKRPDGKDKVVISGVVGKDGERSAGTQDDLAFCLSFCLGVCEAVVDRQLEGFDYRWLP